MLLNRGSRALWSHWRVPQGCAWVPGPGEGVFACGAAKSKVPHPSAAMLPVLLSVLVGSVLLWDVETAVAGRGLDPTARLGSRKLRGSAGASSLWFCGRCLGTVGLAQQAGCLPCGFPCQQLPVL